MDGVLEKHAPKSLESGVWSRKLKANLFSAFDFKFLTPDLEKRFRDARRDARVKSVRRIVKISPNLFLHSMIVWFQLEREDGTPKRRKRPALTLPYWRKYNTVTLPASQSLFFRGENDARVESPGGGVIKTDSNQVTIGIAHPDRLVVEPFSLSLAFQMERDAMKRPPRLVHC